jgi:anaphase-promoting complex subunit 4
MSSTLTEPTAQAGRLTSTNILAIADNLGRLYFFLDGSYPLGVISLSPISLDPEISIVSLHMDKHGPTFLAHPQVSSKGNISTDLKPTVVQLPLLATGMVEDMAIMSSTARELAWYSMRVVKEMRTVWFGSDSFTGARELGPKWVRALKTKQKDQFGREFTLHGSVYAL